MDEEEEHAWKHLTRKFIKKRAIWYLQNGRCTPVARMYELINELDELMGIKWDD